MPDETKNAMQDNELLRAAIRFPVALTMEMAQAWLTSLGELDVLMNGATPSRLIQGAEVKPSYSSVNFNASSPPPMKLEELLMDHGISHYQYGNETSDHNEVESDIFFGDRNYIKAYEFTVLFVAEGQDVVLENAQRTTRNDTTEQGLAEYHRQVIIDLLKAANTNAGISLAKLPRPWQPAANLPDFLVEDPAGSGNVFWAHDSVSGEMLSPELFDELDAYVVSHVKPLSRHLIRGKNDERRQSNALERIAKSIDRIEETGLKSRGH